MLACPSSPPLRRHDAVRSQSTVNERLNFKLEEPPRASILTAWVATLPRAAAVHEKPHSTCGCSSSCILSRLAKARACRPELLEQGLNSSRAPARKHYGPALLTIRCRVRLAMPPPF